MKSLIVILLLLAIIGNALSAGQTQIPRRRMTEKEFERIKSLEGVFKEGVNYNKLINGYGTGLRPPTAEAWQQIYQRPVLIEEFVSDIESLPSNHDNSESDWFPPIGNQDGEGSCVSWAFGYYLKTFQEAREHRWDLSGCTWDGGYYGHPNENYQDFIFSPDFIYHQVNNGEDNGSYYSDNMDLLERIGCSTWSLMPYDPDDHTSWPSEPAWREAPWYRSSTGYAYMYVDSDAGLQDLKQMLADSNLAVISVNADYYEQMTDDDLWTLDNYNPSSRNHANTVVGYDDNYGPYEENGNPDTYGAFKVANSWGVGGSWENVDDGYLYISYACMKQRIDYIYYYENQVGYQPDRMAVFKISHEWRGECDITLGFGSHDNPDATKPFDDYNNDGGMAPFCENHIVVDVTEFGDYVSGGVDNYFLQLYDGDSETTGIIDSFLIETYDDYATESPTAIYISEDTPQPTVNGSEVFVQVQTDESQMPDLAQGADSAGWQDAIVIDDQRGEFHQDGTTEPFPVGYYYINSVITNAGNVTAYFDQNQSVWQIFLDDSLIQNWGWWDYGNVYEIYYHDRNAYSGFYQYFEQGYGVVFDITEYNNVTLDSVDFAHYGWENEHGPYYYNLHIYDWENEQELLTLYDLEAGDSYSTVLWEEGIDLGGLEGVDSVGVFIEPLSGSDGDALPGLLTDESTPARANTSFIIDINDPFHNYTELSSSYPDMGDFLVDLWITGDTSGSPQNEALQKTMASKSVSKGSVRAAPKAPIPVDIQSNLAATVFKFQLGYDQLLSENTYNLAPGECKAGYAKDSVYLSQGTHNLRMEIDVNNNIKESDENNNRYIRTIQVGSPSVAESQRIVPDEAALAQNYPNPFNPSTKINYVLPKANQVKLAVFNMLGQKVAVLIDGRKPAGYHEVAFDGSQLSSGVYYYRLSTDNGFTKIRKMILLK